MTSPLAEASPRSLEDLFNAEPFALTPEERRPIVMELRRQRDAYNAADHAGKRPPRAPKASAVKLSPEATAKMNFDDLGL